MGKQNKCNIFNEYVLQQSKVKPGRKVCGSGHGSKRMTRSFLLMIFIGAMSGGAYAHADTKSGVAPFAHSAKHLESGDVYFKQGDMKEAMVNYNAAFDIASRASKEDLKNEVWRHGLSVSLGAIGDIQVAQQDLRGAIVSYKEARDVSRSLLANDPENDVIRFELAVLEKDLANVFVEQGNAADALINYRASTINMNRNSTGNPENELWLMSLAWRNWRIAQRGNDQAVKWREVLRLMDFIKEETGFTEQDMRSYKIAAEQLEKHDTTTK